MERQKSVYYQVPSRYEGDEKQILEDVKSQHDGLLFVLATKDGCVSQAQM